ncbi:ABC transporter permease [Paraglaciecola arctica]|uniref:Peptide ABC transporter permease n=1 Tax=Paraglaciecola arctica BSs20135 TaxID=493475 RepID=K6YRX8_9ALTE|nr:ABC transporter permease [Paraglaciecola arctica]GAC19433.1 peptide ABC transporter permease [Paraglaciecola arctica BSs20135]
MLLKLVLASLWSRRVMAILTCTSIAISMLVLIGVEHLRAEVKNNFERTISGVDMIVGSRTSGINLLLFSVFKIGNPSNNIQWKSYQDIVNNSQVAWSVPLSMGDSHQGFSVIGTTADYFEYFKYGDKQQISFKQGEAFKYLYEVVLGADVARKLGYNLNQSLVMSHGTGKVSFTHHDEHPFKVVGILKPTGTPADQSLYIPLQSIDILHQRQHIHNELLSEVPLGNTYQPQLSAFLLGSKSKIAVLKLQRDINQYKPEPLSAILPALALRELWKIVGVVEISLRIISWLILATALICMTTMLLASMKERERELAVLRALGAKAHIIILLIVAEALILTLIGALAGYLLVTVGLLLGQPLLEQYFALYISPVVNLVAVGRFFSIVAAAAVLLSFIPAVLAYKKSLISGLKQ